MMPDALPLVSIVIPTFNHASYLKEAIESVLAQTYPRIELIVLDDGSTDNTRELLGQYTGRLYWESHPNMGQAATLNKGWRSAKGAFLGYLSADDVLLPEAVSVSLDALMSSPDAALVYCDYNLLSADSRVLKTMRAPEFDYSEMVVKFICPPGPGAVFRRSALDGAGPWSGGLRLAPDYEFWLRLGLQGRFLRVPRTLAGLRVHQQSQSFATVDEWGSDEYIRITSSYFEQAEVPPGVAAHKRQALSNAYMVAARSHLASRRYLTALARARQALYLYPRNLQIRTLKLFLHLSINHIRYRSSARLAAGGSRSFPTGTASTPMEPGVEPPERR